MNRTYAAHLITELISFGIQEFYICAGARNTPLVEILWEINNNVKIFHFFEERSAGFYALGRIKALQKPVAVITTSGTAVGELLPSVMEGFCASLPLVVISADRPKRYRGSGAPQAAWQKDIFGVYVSRCFDLENEYLFLENVPGNKPLHINICFDVPLIDKSPGKHSIPVMVQPRKFEATHQANKANFQNAGHELQKFLKSKKNIFIIVSKLRKHSHESLIQFLKKINAPIYLEAISQLRHEKNIQNICIRKPDNYFNKYCLQIDGIIKIGGTPTHRIWRDLDETHAHIPILSLDENEFPGLPNAKHLEIHLETFFEKFLNEFEFPPQQPDSSIFAQDKKAFQEFLEMLSHNPTSEQTLVRALFLKSLTMPKPIKMYLGPSLPIRHWDAIAWHDKNLVHMRVESSRGLNGIDGVLSAFVGFSEENFLNWGLFGDLTCLYDPTSPWVFAQRPNLACTFFVINNSGGQIFRNVVPELQQKLVLNSHQISFEYWAKMWKLDYTKVTNAHELTHTNFGHGIVEIVPTLKE